MKHLSWNKILWNQVEKRIQRLQIRIYKASCQGNLNKVHFLQYKLIKSLDAKLLAVRKITVENKENALDKFVYTATAKARLVKKLKIEITPSNEGLARAQKALAVMALEPQWEALFEPNSYGNRLGRTVHDTVSRLSKPAYESAVEAVFKVLRVNSKKSSSERFVLKATACLENLNMDFFIKKLNTISPIEKRVQTWLPKEFPDLFVNIVFHGLENHLKDWILFQTWPTVSRLTATQRHQTYKTNKIKSISIIRYLETFLVIHSNKEIVQKAQEATIQWFAIELGLDLLDPGKSILVSSREGFDFLEFRFLSLHFQNQYRTKIYPSKDAQKKIVKKVGDICRRYRAISTYDLIGVLRPILLSWGNYYRFCECKEVFGKIDRQVFQILRAWVFRRDRRHGRIAIKQNYFPAGRTFQFDNRQYKNNWVLCGSTKAKGDVLKERFLPKIAWIQSSKYIKVRGNATP